MRVVYDTVLNHWQPICLDQMRRALETIHVELIANRIINAQESSQLNYSRTYAQLTIHWQKRRRRQKKTRNQHIGKKNIIIVDDINFHLSMNKDG